MKFREITIPSLMIGSVVIFGGCETPQGGHNNAVMEAPAYDAPAYGPKYSSEFYDSSYYYGDFYIEE